MERANMVWLDRIAYVYVAKLVIVSCRGGGRYLRLGGHQWWCVRKYAHAGALRSLLRPYLYSNQDSSYLELILRLFVTKSFRDRWVITVRIPAIRGWSSKGVKKVTIPDSLKGGVHVPLVPPPPVPPPMSFFATVAEQSITWTGMLSWHNIDAI